MKHRQQEQMDKLLDYCYTVVQLLKSFWNCKKQMVVQEVYWYCEVDVVDMCVLCKARSKRYWQDMELQQKQVLYKVNPLTCVKEEYMERSNLELKLELF